jgi:menaquinone-dependent protoporphyrinogen oxidase
MKTLIAYTSRHGSTEKCANKLKEKLPGEIDIYELKTANKLNLFDYETIIIGGSIHAGNVQAKVKKFCNKNLGKLKEKKLGLFLCCMGEGEKAESQFNAAFPEELINHATATGLFGGEFLFERMNFMERYIIKKISKMDKSISKLSEENINNFVQQLT